MIQQKLIKSNNLQRIFFILLVGLLFISVVNASIYYVDSITGDDSNDGLTRTRPFKTIGYVNSLEFNPGDKILFKRGSSWNETLIINESGTEDNYIIFGAWGQIVWGNPTIHDVEDGVDAWSLEGQETDYIKILDFAFYNISRYGIRIDNSESSFISKNYFEVTGRAGVVAVNNHNLIVKENVMITPEGYYADQTDGIYASQNNENRYVSNIIITNNYQEDEHADCIQLYEESNARVVSNYLKQETPKGANSQGLYSTYSRGSFVILNNTIILPNSTSSVLGIYHNSDNNSNLNVDIVHNNVTGKWYNTVRTDTPYLIFKFNTIYGLNETKPVVWFNAGVDDYSEIYFNHYFTNNPKPLYVYFDELGYHKYLSLEEWQEYGADLNSEVINYG